MLRFATKLALFAAITVGSAWTAEAQTRMNSHVTRASAVDCQTEQKAGAVHSKEICGQAEQATNSGDYNGDGQVDANDFTTWQQDSTADGTVDAHDYAIWRTQ